MRLLIDHYTSQNGIIQYRMIFSLRSPDYIVMANLGSLSLTYDVIIFSFRLPLSSTLEYGSESRGPLE